MAQEFLTLGISVLLGLLVGLQREVSQSRMAGVRTFPLITLLGTFCAMLARDFGFWILPAGFLGVVAIVVLGNLLEMKRQDTDAGMTTEVAILLMYAVGAYLVEGPTAVAVAAGTAVAVLLHLKPELHGFASRLSHEDVRAIMQFALITFIILPVLPNETYGPFNVINPYRTWLLVVLIVGISLTGYLAYKLLGHRAGTLLGGVLGGMISSTATTVSYSRRARRASELGGLAAVVIMVASTMVYFRVLVEIGVVAPSFFPIAVVPILILAALGAVLSIVLWLGARDATIRMPEQKNPTEMTAAVTFAFLYTTIFLVVAAAREHFPDGALFLVAAVSGLTDLDAITLSTSQMVAQGRIEPELGWRLILTALIANFAFKGGVAAVFGGPELFRRILAPFSISVIAALLLILFL